MTKWEYKIDTYSPNLDKFFWEWLNNYGNKGWELVQALPAGSGYMKCIFKRLND